MTTAPTRRIRVDVQIDGGRVRMDLTEPTAEQVAAINGLLEQWLDDSDAETAAEPAPADTQRLEPIRGVSTSDVEPKAELRAPLTFYRCDVPGCDAEPFVRPQGLGAHRRYKHGAPVETRPDLHRATEPEPLAAQTAVQTFTRDLGPTPLGVVLCHCGHGERMHERDELAGRGQCHHAGCGCSEYRAVA